MRRRAVLALFCLTLVIPTTGPLLAASGQGQARLLEVRDARAAAAPDTILVRFRPRVSRRSREAVHRRLRARVVRTYRSVDDLVLVRVPAKGNLRDVLRRYRRRPEVLYAEPDWRRTTRAKPNDPDYGDLWGMSNKGKDRGKKGADIDAEKAWNITKGSREVVVGTIDTGVDYDHQDLNANMHRNECDTNGIDDDGNGWADDCYGIAPVYGNSDPFDDVEHGTHVAGTIGAVGDNGIGVVGVNWEVSMIACKFLSPDGGDTSDAIACLDYFADLKDSGVNLVATNNSWGGGGFSQALYDAIEAHLDRGILFIGAAGNALSDNDFVPDVPSGYDLPNIISVGATDNRDNMPEFTNWGLHSVHVSAPGSHILSTLPFDTYEFFDGTSMAAPHVTGVAALIKAANPDATWSEIKNLILAGAEATPLAALTATGRRINGFNALDCKSKDGVVRAPLRPLRNGITSSLAGSTLVSMLSIVCDAPGEGDSIDITVESADGARRAPLTLKDNGKGGDLAAGDGVYSGEWEPDAPGSYVVDYGDGMTTSVTALREYAKPKSTPFQWRAVDGPSLDLGDETNAKLVTPFPIRFGGASFPVLVVHSNGTLSVTDTFPSDWWAVRLLPAEEVSTLIAPFYDDFVPVRGTDSNVFVDTIGAAPNREFVVEWRDIRPFNCRGGSANVGSFQVVFFENSDDIVFNYADPTFGGECKLSDGGFVKGIQVSSSTVTEYNSFLKKAKTAVRWQVR